MEITTSITNQTTVYRTRANTYIIDPKREINVFGKQMVEAVVTDAIYQTPEIGAVIYVLAESIQRSR